MGELGNGGGDSVPVIRCGEMPGGKKADITSQHNGHRQ